MSNISISLSANTSAYVKRIKDARTETDRNIIKMEQRIDQFAQDVNKNFTSVGGSIDAMIGSLRNMKGGGYIAAVAGIGYAATSAATSIKNLAIQTVESQKVITIAAERAKVTADEIQRWGMITSTVGIQLENFGDICKDIQDKLGDFVTTGGGAFVDFFDTVKGKSNITAQELQKLSGPEVLMKVVEEMEKVGASGSQMTWVLESLGNDASNLLPLLKDNAKGFKELKERMDEIESVPQVLAEATLEVQLMEQASKQMWSNFGVWMSNEFSNMFGYISKATTALNNVFAGANAQAIVDSHKDNLLNGNGFSIGVDDNKQTLDDKEKALEQIVAAEIKGNEELRKIKLDHQKEISRLESREFYNRGKWTAEEAEANKAEIEKHQNAILTATETYMKEGRKKYAEHYSRLGEVRALNGFDESSGNTGKESTDKLFKSEKFDNEVDHLKQKTELTDKLTAAKSRQVEEEAKLAKMREEAEASKAATDDADIATRWEKRIKAQEAAVEDAKAVVEDGNKAIEKADKEFYDKQAKDAKSAADAITREKKRENDEKLKLIKEQNELERRALMEGLQNEIKVARTVADKIIANKKYQHAVVDQMEADNLDRINRRVELGSITEEQAAAEQVELTRRTKAMKFAAEEEAYLAEMEAKQNRYYESHELDIANAEAKLEWYEEQKKLGHLTDVEYAEKKKELEEDINHSKEQLQSEYLNIVSSSMSELGNAFEQGSKEAKVAFAVEKGIKIAEAMLLMESNALKAKASAPNPVVGEALAIASRIKDGASIATMAATAIGQFHSGADEVDQTGSYILKKGERIVQPAANKDLTAFLEGNGKSSGEIKIDAPLNIQGDANIDENKFKAMLVQHRENITQAVRLAQRENPSLR